MYLRTRKQERHTYVRCSWMRSIAKMPRGYLPIKVLLGREHARTWSKIFMGDFPKLVNNHPENSSRSGEALGGERTACFKLSSFSPNSGKFRLLLALLHYAMRIPTYNGDLQRVIVTRNLLEINCNDPS